MIFALPHPLPAYTPGLGTVPLHGAVRAFYPPLSSARLLPPLDASPGCIRPTCVRALLHEIFLTPPKPSMHFKALAWVSPLHSLVPTAVRGKVSPLSLWLHGLFFLLLMTYTQLSLTLALVTVIPAWGGVRLLSSTLNRPKLPGLYKKKKTLVLVLLSALTSPY